LGQLAGRLLLSAVGLGEAALENPVLLLEIDDDFLKLPGVWRLARTRPGNGQRPEGGGKC